MRPRRRCANIWFSKSSRLKNPLDAGNPTGDAADAALCRVVDRRSQYRHACLGRHVRPVGTRVRDPAVTESILDSTDKPVFGFIRMAIARRSGDGEFQDEVGFPFLQGLPAIIRALGALAFYGARKGRRIAALPPPTGKRETLQGACLRSGARASTG